MLKTTKLINLNGTSEIEGVVVVRLNASIPSETGVGSVNQYIQNAEVYDLNKAAVRADVSAFQSEVYDIEDSLSAAPTPTATV